MKVLQCRGLGYECGFEAHGETGEEALKKTSEHAAAVHGMKPQDMTPEEIAKVKAATREA